MARKKKEDLKLKNVKIDDKVLKLIRHNTYMMNKYNTQSDNDEYTEHHRVKITIKNKHDYLKLLNKGQSVEEINARIKEESKQFELPSSLKKMIRKINSYNKKVGKSWRATYGATYRNYMTYGYAHARSSLRVLYTKAQDVLFEKQVDALIEDLKYDFNDKQLRAKKDQSQGDYEAYKLFKDILRDIRKHKKTLPEKVRSDIYDVLYDYPEKYNDKMTAMTKIRNILNNFGIN